MLKLQLSNRFEILCDALVREIGTVPTSPFTAQQIVVPSSAMRRHLTLAIAAHHGVCANIDCVYLAEWLWHQIARVVRTVTVESPFAASVLTWRIYQLLQDTTWHGFPRLANYLKDPNPVMRFELAAEIAALFEQYITYRPDWLHTWQGGERISMPKAATAQLDDQGWQAELWRRISARMDATLEHPAAQFLRSLDTAGAAGNDTFGLPQTVHVFCLPAMPPLYLALLTGLARWVDITLYVLNPCREYWFDIVDPKRLHALTVRGAMGHHETANRLLASWGGQTKAYIELLLDRTENAPVDDTGFDDHFAPTTLGRLQQAIFTLTELAPASLAAQPRDRSIEIHVCHSLTRQLEVLQDQLLALLAGPSAPKPEQILIVTPDLDAAAPLIDAVFGNVPDERRLPYAMTGRGRSGVNAAARALLAVLAILPSRFPASALIELLQQPLIARRFRIDADDLPSIENWLRDSGIRWGIDAEHRHELDLPGSEHFTIADGLDRLFLGYALPQRLSAPSFGRIPAGNAEGSEAEVLGSMATFIEQLTALRADFRVPRLPEAWLEAMLSTLDTFIAPTTDDLEDVAEVRATLRELHLNMRRGGLTTPAPFAVVRTSLETALDEAARGGVPTGSITFSSLSSLRNLPFRFIAVIGLDDGAFPSPARPREFDLMAAAPRAGDRQRRVDDRNLFLDLVLAARERLYLSYTGRSIRDDSVLPASVVVAELIETLLPALARQPGDAQALTEARKHLIVEHPLQAFAEVYFQEGDPRRRSFNRELCEALRQAMIDPVPGPEVAAFREDGGDDATGNLADIADASDVGEDDDAPEGNRTVTRFFTAPLAPPGIEWQRVSLEQLLRFFRQPCLFLLRHRLGLALYSDEELTSDEEPFLPNFHSRQALAERLLPQAMQGLGAQALSRLAQAGVEYPPGALGATALQDEMGSLRRFAREVRQATQAPTLPPRSVDVPFVFDGEDWHLATLLTEQRATGLVLHRYDESRASDYLAGWLTHLVAAAASPTPLETRWISRDGEFRFTPIEDARALLEPLLALYRRGLREPVHFFPKSAWAYIKHGRNPREALDQWHRTYGKLPGEETHPAYRLALRGIDDPLDADFKNCAEIVFAPALAHLDDPRL